MVNMIAAGEVIERPASVVKELLENSIDAGATAVAVTIEDGGRKLISVSDNGCGMEPQDLAQAFDSHTTSKIKTSSDLRTISTLGFRGEALASIASVAQVRATSRTEDSPAANCIEIDCGDKGSLAPCSADYGTTIQVRDIFYKLPARRKFLKTANTEMGHISEQFTRIALANNALDMLLVHNGRELVRLSGGQPLRQRIGQLFSAEMSESLVETESDEKGTRIFALLGRPTASRTSNKFQYTFLNGRFIRDKFISHAIKEAYRGMLEPDRFGVIFLFIEMPCEEYDVNVHPTKTEVRFYNANLLHSQILGCLRQRLLGLDAGTPAKLPSAPSSKTTATNQKDAAGPGQRDQKIADAMAEFFKRHKAAQTQPLSSLANRQFTGAKSAPPQKGRDVESISVPQPDDRETGFIQIHSSYIIQQTQDGFVIVDQHALHERILYEGLNRRIATGKLESQRLLMPESLEITDAQAELLKTNAELIDKLGIEIVPFGPKTVAVQAFPTLLSGAAPADFVQDLVDLLADRAGQLDPKRLLDEVLNMAACKAAIKAGQKLSDSEIRQLLADGQRTECSGHCPHGRPTTIKFSLSDLEKQFKRT
jgi:DNA mismatch repair protein MutL